MPTFSHKEPTPNPNAYKFHAAEPLLEPGLLLPMNSEAEGTKLPIARALFGLGCVNAVLVQDTFVSVNANEWGDWDEIEGVVKRHLPMFDRAEAARQAAEAAAQAQAAKSAREPNERLDKINELIETFVRPYLANDGGGLELIDLEGDTLRVRYQGACGGCPSAAAGTLRAIEGMIRDRLEENVTLEAV